MRHNAYSPLLWECVEVPIRRITAYLITVLAAGSLFGQSNTFPPAKQLIEQQYVAERAIGTQNPAPRDPQAPYPLVQEAPFQTGIFNDGDAPFSVSDGDICNRWQRMQNGSQVLVFAGADANASQQGIAVIMTIPDYPAKTTIQRVLTPVQVGKVCVMTAQNGTLVLMPSDRSGVMTLNVSTGAIVTVPTIQCTGGYFLTQGVRATLGFSVVQGTVSIFTYNFRTVTQTVQFSSTSISQISGTGNTATFSGQGTLNGQSGYQFTATAKDGGAAGSGLDSISLTITGPNNYSYIVSSALTGGDIIVRP